MMANIAPRLRKPLGNLLAGTIFAAAWAVRGGPFWYLAVVLEVAAVARAVAAYVLGGEDSAAGAVIGSRLDERQRQVSMRSWALSGRGAMLAAFLGLTIAVAVKSAFWLPFTVVFAVTAVGYLFGLWNYGSARDRPGSDPADEAGVAAATGSPVTS
jgi:MFS family permease